MNYKLCLIQHNRLYDLEKLVNNYSVYNLVNDFQDKRWDEKDIKPDKKVKLISILKKDYEETDKEVAIKKIIDYIGDYPDIVNHKLPKNYNFNFTCHTVKSNKIEKIISALDNDEIILSASQFYDWDIHIISRCPIMLLTNKRIIVGDNKEIMFFNYNDVNKEKIKFNFSKGPIDFFIVIDKLTLRIPYTQYKHIWDANDYFERFITILMIIRKIYINYH